jgi:hypothetical protein
MTILRMKNSNLAQLFSLCRPISLSDHNHIQEKGITLFVVQICRSDSSSLTKATSEVLSPATDSSFDQIYRRDVALKIHQENNSSAALLTIPARSVQQIIRFGRIRQSIILIRGTKSHQYYYRKLSYSS